MIKEQLNYSLGLGRFLGTMCLSLISVLLSWLPSYGQVSTVNYAVPTADAMVANGGVENTNFGSQTTIDVFHRNNQQIPMVFRSFIQFDLSNIPANAIIVSADLKLTAQAVDNGQNHPLYIERVNGTNWSESTITWNAQPGVATADQISIPHSATSAVGLQTFDVKNHVQQMVANPGLNKGWRIRLQQEQAAVDFGVQYHSKEAAQATNRPQLTVEYILPIEINTTVNHCTAGQTDGTLSAFLSGGSTYGLSNIFFYKTVRNASYDGTATITNVKTTHNVQYNTSTKEITAENLEPGVYILGVFDAEYYSGSDQRFVFYRHVLVGRNGEVTTGILYPDYRYQENVTISKDKPTATNPLDRANTNYHTHTSLIPLRVADAPNVYEYASLIQYEMDFDNQLEFTQADLRMKAWAQFFRFRNSSNALTYSRITSAWEEETVTWNTRPSIDASTGVTLAATPTMGYETTHLFDTLDLLTFIPHWQTHPEDNHGIELALETYGATDYAQRSFKSASNENNYLELQWEVKDPVSASFDDDELIGRVEVVAPQGHPQPYTYLISYQALPDMATIWNGIKDSIPVDSTTFFRGKTQGNYFAFENLEPEHYYVGVYDNDGVKILDGDAVVAPKIVLTDNVNVTLTDGTLQRGSNGNLGTAGISGLIRSSQNGGLDFELAELGGDLVVGFNDFSQGVPQTTDAFEYSIAFFTDNSFDVLKGSTILFEGTAALNDRFRIAKINNEMVFYHNAFEVARTSILAAEKADLTGATLFRTALGVIHDFIKVGHFASITNPIEVVPYHPECGETEGYVRLKRTAPAFVGGTGTYTITDVITNATVSSGTLSGALYDEVALPVGEYKVTYTYTVDGIIHFYWEYFSMGTPVFWNILNAHFDPADDANGIVAEGSLDIGEAITQNRLPDEEEGVFLFKTNFKKYYVPFGDPVLFDPYSARIDGVNQVLDNQMSIRVMGLGDGIINRYIWALNADGTMAGTFFETTENGPFKVRRINDSGTWKYEMSFKGDPIPFATVNETTGTEHQNIRFFAKGKNAEIFDCYASFCSGLTQSGICAHPDYELDGNYYLTNNGKFCFVYNEEYNDPNIQFTIYNHASHPVATQDNFETEDLIYGENRIVLDLSDEGFCLGKGYFVLEIINDKKEKFYLRFYNDYDGCLPFDDGAAGGFDFVDP